ncbi:MAG: glycerophosphodiester phosphodiesterase family protein [Reichenbachiella sp.]|uniref:glycerophosphodiester phosphodiesterase family protein n=2 Tax=Reichenbachiella sp. TaxID=2184521 RepID=UPI00326480ED
MKVICYRCGGGENPENTILGIEHCLRVNPEWPIEMDLQLTKDGEVVLFHDANTKRITGEDFKIADLTLSELRTLNVGHTFRLDDEYLFRDSPLRAPTLIEVVKKFPKAEFVFDIHSPNPLIISKVISIIEASPIDQPPTIVSANDKIISEFKIRKPGWKYSAASKEAKKLIYSSFVFLDFLFPLQSDYLMIPQTYGSIRVLTSRVVNHVLKRKRAIWAWIHEGEKVKTVETLEQALSLYNQGVEAVFTDYPKKLFEELK